MIDDAVGAIHVGLALVALVLGFAVVMRRKGDRLHRTLGHLYVSSMLGLNGTALMIYDLFGGFGPFHWAALASLATVIAGMAPAVLRRPRETWFETHAYIMAWSYVGLVAAAAAEVATRVLTLPFWASVGLLSFVVIAGGGWIVQRRVPRILAGPLSPRS